MFVVPENDLLVPFDGSFRVADAPTRSAQTLDEDDAKRALKKTVRKITKLQQRFYAHDQAAVLLIFQAMDAAGKDSTIRAVMSGINPAGCQVFSFKRPSHNELDQDFLWRTSLRLPQRGRFGIFNRSYYEEVLVVKVMPEILQHQRLHHDYAHEDFWAHRYESIRDHEKHLARNGTLVLKFWLNVSREEQKNRFLSRIDNPGKNWKFEAGDLKMRKRWDAFMDAYETALNETSRPWAPWYAVPADDKPTMRLTVAKILEQNLRALDPKYPKSNAETLSRLEEFRSQLLDD